MIRASILSLVLSGFLAVSVAAQRGGGPPAGPPPTPRAAAPFDLSGTWVSVVTEDWRWRMVIPKKGDYTGVPLNPEGRKVADTWDPSKMAADGCKPYGAPALMRVPGRLRIAWENDTTLKIETDAGQQTRLLRFDANRPDPATRSWQGHSVAEWQRITQPGGQGVSLQQAAPRVGALRVITTNVRAGFLRKNGVPYSENAVIDGVFRSPVRLWRGLIDGADDSRRPAISEPAVHYQHAFQARSRRFEVDAHAV